MMVLLIKTLPSLSRFSQKSCTYLQSGMHSIRLHILTVLLFLQAILGSSQSLVSSGSITLSNGVHVVDFSLGEIASNFLNASDYVYTIGFHQPVSVPELPKKGPEKTNIKDSSLVVYQFLSPNNDGKNETFYINALEKYPENEVFIMDRTGKTVFYAKNYTNNWAGEGLPEDQYFYVVKIAAQNITLKGGLVLAR